MALGWRIGRGARICGGVSHTGSGRVVLGDNCWVGLNTRFYTIVDTEIVIEDNCDVAPECVFHSGSHRTGDHSHRAGDLHGENIRVGAGSWVCVGAILLPGAQVGPGVIVAAGAVVPRGRYEADGVLAGVPAARVRTLP